MFSYFGYGSNMALMSLHAKVVSGHARPNAQSETSSRLRSKT